MKFHLTLYKCSSKYDRFLVLGDLNYDIVKFCLEVCTFYLYNCTVFFPAYLVPNEISMYVLSQGILVSL